MIEFRKIHHSSGDYQKTVSLRQCVLLDPFDITLTEAEWNAESEFLHFGLFQGSQLMACCFVEPLEDGTGKLRQMAVLADRQGTGLGRRLLAGVEQDLESLNFGHVIMDARKPAVGFYDRLGYRITSDEFELVGISHYRMEKPLAAENEPAVIVLLGAPNAPDGSLSPIAQQRCCRVIVEHHRHPDWLILPTGGFGEHFNRAPKAHGFYTTQYLVDRGVERKSILPIAESSHTIDDANKAKPILETTGLNRLILVTSEFHSKRALKVFERALPGWQIHLSCSLTDLPQEKLSRLRAHELAALSRLQS